MVNSFGAKKKAPYAEALNRNTTAAALRSFAVMTALAWPVSLRSFGCSQVLCYEQIQIVLPTNPLLSHRFRNPGGRGPLRGTVEAHSSKRYSPKSHTAVKKMMSNAIRNASQSQRSTGS